jgi:hypothetical protein
MTLERFTIWQRILIAAGIVLIVFLILLGITRLLGDAAAQDDLHLPTLALTDTTGGVSNKETVIAAAEQAMLEHVQRLVLTALSLPDVEGAKRLETGLRRAKDRDATMREIIEKVYK